MIDVSVVIATYNRPEYLSLAIDSALEQTCPGVEVIVVDDGSDGETRRLLEAYQDRIRCIFTRHGGIAHARNVGMRAARGRYLTFLDSDDLYYPYALELESRMLDRYPDVGMIYSEMSGFDDHGFFDRYHLRRYHESGYRDSKMTYDRMFSKSVPLGDAQVLPEQLLHGDEDVRHRRAYFGNIFDVYLTNLVLFHNSMMVRRDLLSVIGEQNEHLHYWHDMDFALRIARYHSVCFVDVPTYKLRYHSQQMSGTGGPRGKYVWMRKQQNLLRVVKKHAHADPADHRRHWQRLDRHLAHLHRAAAVPMMLMDSGIAAINRRHSRTARKHLTRCGRLGHPERLLWLMTFAPAPVRRVLVSLLELAHTWFRAHRSSSAAVVATG